MNEHAHDYDEEENDGAPRFDNPKIVAIADGHLLLRSGAVLPDRCVFCNADASEGGKRIAKTLYYANPLIYFLILVNILICCIAYYIVRKPVDVSYAICHQHVALKSKWGGIAVASLIGSLVCFVAGGTMSLGFLVVLGGLLLVAMLVATVMASKDNIVAKKHADGVFWMKGFGLDYLESLQAKR